MNQSGKHASRFVLWNALDYASFSPIISHHLRLLLRSPILSTPTENQETILVIDFGGQYNQLIARRVRECGVYCEICSYRRKLADIKRENLKGIIFTGGPNSVYLADSATIDPEIYTWGVPILGICYGAQLMSMQLGGRVSKAPEREYGKTLVTLDTASKLFEGLPKENVCWMSHNDYIEQPAPGFAISAATPNCPVAASENAAQGFYNVQFHPEVLHTENGVKMLANFVFNVCGCQGTWKMASFVEKSVQELRQQIGDKKVLCALSGGVDSSVCAAMLAKAVGRQLTCVFVDHGLLRKGERDRVCQIFGPDGPFDINFVCADASDRFLSKLAGVTAPETKRKIIGEEFIRVFEAEAKKIGTVDFLAQGTIYPDVVESGLGGESATIKSHHNVGGLPEHVDFKEIIEPLRDLFKDEVRQAGRELGLPDYQVYCQPFPGPGLAVRVIG
ncbi:MAG TPA: glutamine-hydrolyzing GMP synthase, partial [Sutterella sp.]|nr:glutamine-hydrolyzing GMP synthase [Sutterella sp.]